MHQDPQPQPWIDFAINIYLLNQEGIIKNNMVELKEKMVK